MFSFLSGLYFRGKLAYATRFARPKGAEGAVQVITANRGLLPAATTIGVADLRAFSQAHERLLKDECGSTLESYFQRGHWRMIMPFSRRNQQGFADKLFHCH